MSDRDFDPKDGGYIRIMNEFVDKLITYRLDSNEWSIMMLLIRRTWGVKGRPWADLKWKFIRETTQLAESSLTYAMRKLKARNILHTLETENRTTRYKINSKISTWKNPTEIMPIRKPSLPHSSEVKTYLTPVRQNTSLHRGKLPHSSEVIPIKDIIKDKLKDTPHSPPAENGDSGSVVLTKKQMIEQDAKQVIDFLNFLSGKNFQHSKTSLGPIIARMNEGATLEQCLQVCQNKWDDSDLKEKFYRPITLFRASLFEGYLNEKGTKRKLSKQKAKMKSTVGTFYARRQNESKGEEKKET